MNVGWISPRLTRASSLEYPSKVRRRVGPTSRLEVIPNHLAPVPSLYVAKNGGERVRSCGPKGLRTKLVVDAGVKLGFNGFHRVL